MSFCHYFVRGATIPSRLGSVELNEDSALIYSVEKVAEWEDERWSTQMRHYDHRADQWAGDYASPPGMAVSGVPLFDPSQGQTVLVPESSGAGYWVGAPSIIWDPSRQSFLLTYRRRRPREIKPDRGYVAHVAESQDGLHFHDIATIQKSDFDTTSMEKFSLAFESGGPYRLYVSYVDPADNRWRIDVLEASRPEDLGQAHPRPVLTAATTGTEGVKDPWVFRLGGLWQMLVSYAAPRQVDVATRARMHQTADVYNTGVLVAPSGLALSDDGLNWRWEGEIFGVGAEGAWDSYQTRLGCLVYRAPLWIGYYDGSRSVEENYEERCGIAYSFDLRHWQRVTFAGPALVSPHATGSLRYLTAVSHHGALHFYYEYVRADGAHELRRNVVPE